MENKNYMHYVTFKPLYNFTVVEFEVVKLFILEL